MLDNYATVALSSEVRERITMLTEDAVVGSADEQAEVRTCVTARLQELNTREDRFLDLIGDPD